ncbi:MAG: hypothetical protein IJ471_01805 [Eubacterium sp.]|nr:hypothetical protein [Eubacterium sp.]
MNKILKRVGILAAVFVVALLVFSKTLNHEPKDMTADMEAAGLPVVYMIQDSVRLSELHGYVAEMDAPTMGENVTVVPEDNELQLQIDAYGNEIKSLFYEVRSGDGQRLIEDGQDVAMDVSEDSLTAALSLQDLLQLEQEYLLILHLQGETETTHYYTKLMKVEGYDTEECIDFVMDFHAKTLDKEEASKLSMYLEPAADADNTTLQHVTIHNRLRQIYWNELEVAEVTPPIVTVQEANEDYNVILLTSTVSAPNESGGMDYYNVKETYKVRQGIERMYMLDFERNVEEIFRGKEGAIAGNYVQLGIRSQEVDYWSNETGSNVCFVQEGDLWNYNQATNQLVQVYSFRTDVGLDVRENYDQHDIRIINADETGSIDFIVYGYMNRGEHEGEVGISVCHYDSVTNTVEELLFLPASVSYQVMERSISQLLYINDEGTFFLMLGDAIYAIDLESKKYEVFLEGMVDGSCQVSEDGRYVAWVVGSECNTSETMQIADLNTGKTGQVQAPDGYYIKPLGYIQADCIYGYASKTEADSGAFYATALKIGALSEQQMVELTSYSKYGYWIESVEVSNGVVHINLVKNGEMEVTATDSITNKEVKESKQAQVEAFNYGVKETQIRLVLAGNAPEKPPVIKTPKLMLSEESTTLILDEEVFLNENWD